MKTACLWILELLSFLNVQIAAFAAPALGTDQAVRRAAVADPGAFGPDPKLFLLIGFGLLAVGLVANRRYRS